MTELIITAFVISLIILVPLSVVFFYWEIKHAPLLDEPWPQFMIDLKKEMTKQTVYTIYSTTGLTLFKVVSVSHPSKLSSSRSPLTISSARLQADSGSSASTSTDM